MESCEYIIIYDQEEDGGYSGECLELPGAISEGDTFEEFKENMREAIELIQEHYDTHPMSNVLIKRICDCRKMLQEIGYKSGKMSLLVKHDAT